MSEYFNENKQTFTDFGSEKEKNTLFDKEFPGLRNKLWRIYCNGRVEFQVSRSNLETPWNFPQDTICSIDRIYKGFYYLGAIYSDYEHQPQSCWYNSSWKETSFYELETISKEVEKLYEKIFDVDTSEMTHIFFECIVSVNENHMKLYNWRDTISGRFVQKTIKSFERVY